MEILVTPSLKFRVDGKGKDIAKMAGLFRSSRAEGLLELVKKPSLRSRSASAAYWFDYASLFMRSLCAFSDTDPLHVPIDRPAISKHADSTPPLDGGEYISEDFLFDLWVELESHITVTLNGYAGAVRRFIATTYSGWEDVGKIHFHLAENRKPNGKPFAFLSTYSVRIPGKARIQHRPLGVALRESAEKDDRKHLEQLLRPVHRASKRSVFIHNALKSQSIYTPLYLDSDEAFGFIQDIPHCEEAGIVCKVPGWWQKGRPPRAKVSVKVGATAKKSKVGFNQLLDFDVGVSIGGETLTKAQLKKLLEADGPLVDLGGKWIEIDKERIEQMLNVWNDAVSATSSEGISFSQAMRMMAGFSLGDDPLGTLDKVEDLRDWVEVTCGPAFAKLLEGIREPQGKHPKQINKILTKYLGGQLRPYQESGLEWLRTITTLELGGCLADDMGLGKTIQVIAMLLVQKHHIKAKNPSLLVVPASLLGNWQAEVAKFAPDLTYKVLHSSAEPPGNLKKAPRDLARLDFVITTYGMVLRTDWLQKKEWQTVIADEAQTIKNARTKQSKALRSLKALSKVAMTGTPVENSLGDLWSIFDFACPGLLGTETKFKNAVSTMSGASHKGKADYSPLRQLISPYILRRKKSDKSVISDLPDKIEMVSDCFLTKKQAGLYQKEVARLKEALEEADGIQRKGLVLSSLMKFKQICNHPSQYLSNDSYLPALSGKFSKLKELVETIAARQEKVLVFTQFRELTDILAHYLGECFGKEGLIIHGGTAVKKRQKLVEEFQDPGGPPFFVLSLKAGGTGLNLTEASHVIHFDRWWNPAVENQATDRAFRIGQKNNVVVHKFVCKGTVEEKIDAMISEKKALAEVVVEGNKEVNFTNLSDDELLGLVKLDINALGGAQ